MSAPAHPLLSIPPGAADDSDAEKFAFTLVCEAIHEASGGNADVITTFVSRYTSKITSAIRIIKHLYEPGLVDRVQREHMRPYMPAMRQSFELFMFPPCEGESTPRAVAALVMELALRDRDREGFDRAAFERRFEIELDRIRARLASLCDPDAEFAANYARLLNELEWVHASLTALEMRVL